MFGYIERMPYLVFCYKVIIFETRLLGDPGFFFSCFLRLLDANFITVLLTLIRNLSIPPDTNFHQDCIKLF